MLKDSSRHSLIRKAPPKHLSLCSQSPRHLGLKDFLLQSPLLSPALPSILPRHGKKPPKFATRKFLRGLVWLTIFTTIFVAMKQISHCGLELKDLMYESNGKQYEFIGATDLPDFASPVALEDAHGDMRWTVSVPDGLSHPLAPEIYTDICVYGEDVSKQLAEQRNTFWKDGERDASYMEIDEAKRSGLLPNFPSKQSSLNQLPLCDRSLTYILDSSEAGLGKTLMGMWLSYSLAKKEGREFFVDDTKFPYGSIASVLSPLNLVSKCRLPPWPYRTPYPKQAKHLIVNTATLPYVFDSSFFESYDTAEIFRMARDGYEALFQLRMDDSDYVSARVGDLRSHIDDDAALVGVHVRRGDRHPFEFQYQHGYLPPSRYVSVAREIAADRYCGNKDCSIIVASDDTEMYHHPDFKGTLRAQQQFASISQKPTRFAETGSEGGFFREAFWAMDLPEDGTKMDKWSPRPTLAQTGLFAHTEVSTDKFDPSRDYKSHPTLKARQSREYIGRAYLRDLSILAQADEVVCGVSSMGCRILAVMMGSDRLISNAWHNVDGDYGWQALF